MEEEKDIKELLKDTCLKCGRIKDCLDGSGVIEKYCHNCNNHYSTINKDCVLKNCNEDYLHWVPQKSCKFFIEEEKETIEPIKEKQTKDAIKPIEEEVSENGFENFEITEEHFKKFKKYCRFFLDMFNLKDYRVYLTQSDDEDCLAYCSRGGSDRVANIVLCSQWDVEPNDKNLREIALHEVLHVFFSNFSEAASSRFLQIGELDKLEHSLVGTLCRVVGDFMKEIK